MNAGFLIRSNNGHDYLVGFAVGSLQHPDFRQAYAGRGFHCQWIEDWANAMVFQDREAADAMANLANAHVVPVEELLS